MTILLHIGEELQQAAQPMLDALCENRFASRLFARDASLWGSEAEPEASRRLGWVDPFEESFLLLEEAIGLREELRTRSIDRIVLCGMGGSSLGPEVIARESGVDLTVLDSTHPHEVRSALESDLTRTAVVVSSKSGTTIETTSQFRAFQHAFENAGLDPAQHIIFVTDPGSPLAARSQQGYRVFLANPNVGGRFSVLTAFGIVPTVLAGADTSRILHEARQARNEFFCNSRQNPALQLAAVLAAALPEQYVLLIDEITPSCTGLGDWIEQLVAESTGKAGSGVLPVSLPADAPELMSPPENSIVLTIDSTAVTDGQPEPHRSVDEVRGAELTVQGSLGAQFLLWEVATAALGYLIGIDPFDQPDVEAAKVAAREVLATHLGDVPTSSVPSVEHSLSNALSEVLPPHGYLVLQAFLARNSASAQRARQLRHALAESLDVPVALGWGPRYLHSTGQFHKGGPALGVYLQLVDNEASEELEIPGELAGFGALMQAQADGDRFVLEQRGRPVLRRKI